MSRRRHYYNPGENPQPRRPHHSVDRERGGRTPATTSDRERIALAEARRAKRAQRRAAHQAAHLAHVEGRA